MPSLDGSDRVVGHVLWELKSGTYEKTFLVLDFGNHTLHGYAGCSGVSLYHYSHTHTHTHTHTLSLTTEKEGVE